MKPPMTLLTAALATALVQLPLAAQTQDTTVNYTFDELGNLKTVTRPLGRVSTYQYDRLSRSKQEDVTVSGGTLSTKYGYDGQSQVTSVTDPRNLITSYTKDGLGNASALSSPDTAGSGYTVDAAGNVTSMTDARGKTTTMQYDALGRVTLIQYQSGTPTQFEYDGGPGGPASEVGNLTRITDESGSTAYTHDVRGRVLTKVQTVTAGGNSRQFQLRYTYGSSGPSAGKLESMTYPSGARVNYHYDTAGRISSLTVNPSDGTGGTSMLVETPLLQNITWTPSGAVKSWDWGSGTVPTYVRTYDLDGRLVTYPIDASGTIRTLTWNAANLITSYTHAGGSNPGQYDQTFGYDLADRLTSFTQGGMTTTYQYDANGNRTQQTGPTVTYTFSTSSNRLMSASLPTPRNYSYDAAGNLVGDGLLTFTYSDRGRLAHVGGSANLDMFYNGLGQRVAKLGSASNPYVYDEEGRTVGDYAAANSNETVFLGDLPVGVITAAGLSYVIADHLNAPVILAEASGAVQWDWRNRDPFGNNAPVNAFGFAGYSGRFPGQVADQETGLFYNYFRDYDPQTGRYIESDPAGLVAGINTYAYAAGNPLGYVDPSGLSTLGTIGAAVGGWGGRIVGGALGEVLFPAGGGIVGGLVGGRAGAWGGRAAGEWVNQSADSIIDAIKTANRRNDSDGKGGQCRMKNAPRGGGDGGMPGNNQDQNKQARDASKAAGLDPAKQRQLHDAISGQNYTYKQILEIAKEIANGKY